MADENGQSKGPGKAGETTLNLLATLGGLAGPLLFGPDFQGDLGSPFRMGAQMLKGKREEQGLLDLLGGNPHTAPLLEGAQAFHEAGGALNNPDALLHPEVLNTFKVGHTPPPGLMNTLGGMGDQLQANAPQPPQMAPPPAPVAQTGAQIDPASPEFLQRAARLRPDLAEKILLDRASQKTNPLDDIVKMMGIQQKTRDAEEHLTPQEKAALQVQTATDSFKATAPLREAEKLAEKKNADEVKNSQWTDKEATSLRGKMIAITDLQNMIDGGELKPNAALAGVSHIPYLGPAIAGAVNPKFRAMQKQLEAISTDVMAGQPNNKGGVRMLQAIKLHLPTDAEYSQGLAEDIARGNIRRIKEAQLQQLATSHPKRPVSDFADPQMVADYKTLNQIESKDPAKAAKDPRIQALRKGMGIDYNKQVLGEE